MKARDRARTKRRKATAAAADAPFWRFLVRVDPQREGRSWAVCPGCVQEALDPVADDGVGILVSTDPLSPRETACCRCHLLANLTRPEAEAAALGYVLSAGLRELVGIFERVDVMQSSRVEFNPAYQGQRRADRADA